MLEVSPYLKDSLVALVNCSDYDFAVSLAVLAAKKEFLYFDSWVNDRIKTIGDSFVTSLLSYFDDHLIQKIKTIANGSTIDSIFDTANVTAETLTLTFESLLVEQSPEKLSNKNRSKLAEQYKEILAVFPQLYASNTDTTS